MIISIIACTAKWLVFENRSSIENIHREKALSNKASALTKSRYMGIWVVGISNQLIIRGS